MVKLSGGAVIKFQVSVATCNHLRSNHSSTYKQAKVVAPSSGALLSIKVKKNFSHFHPWLLKNCELHPARKKTTSREGSASLIGGKRSHL